MIKKYLAILFFLFIFKVGLPQQISIKVEAKNQALNVILLDLRDQYNFQFSYSDNQLSKYKISVSQTFHSKEEVVQYLLKDLPFKLKISGDVFIIIPDKRKDTKKKSTRPPTNITGQIVEAGSFEPLPFSHILINNHQMVSDAMGSFNFIASADSAFHVRISHLGYYVYDTIFKSSINRQFKLTPSTENLPEITVKNNVVEKATLIGEKSGKIKLNHTISRFLPGQGDNSVFNLLRLMPGIQAAGEQSTDLLIWGSYEGQSQITFDEFTVFGLKNYNDNISVINPFMVKNIEIYKGGFEAKYGNRVGGIVNISGKNGTLQKPTFSFNINPTTINGLIEIPVLKKSSLMLAYRQTYYNLYNTDDFNIFAPTRTANTNGSGKMKGKNIDFDIDVYPDDYQFRDLNLKFSSKFNNGDLFYVSMYGGGDFFNITANTQINRENKGKAGRGRMVPIDITITNTEENRQQGLTAFYGKNWKNGYATQVILTHSGYLKKLNDSLKTENQQNQNVYNFDRANIQNTALENVLKIQNIVPLKNGKQFEFGGGIVGNSASIGTNTNLKDTTLIDTETQYTNNRAFLYLQDNRTPFSRINIKTGLRLNYHRGINQYFFEPRVSASYRASENFKVNASWGIYNQFMYKIANVDRDKNYTYLWVTGNNKLPALRGMHSIGGINYFKNNFTFNIEGYFKTTDNISERRFENRYVGNRIVSGYSLYRGKAKTYGVDTYVKKDFGKHAVWASYTLSKTTESLAYNNQNLPEYELAPHDQRHEFKVAALVNINDFYFSANYVYGSGMQIVKEIFTNEQDISYQRFDAAFTYKFNFKWASGETGLSVLNVFDTQNLKYANLKNIKLTADLGTVKLYSDAVPFTPILFLKVVF